MKIAIIGAGYVGLASAACLADLGHHVTCIDTNPNRIAALNRGVVPIYEPGLADIVARASASGHLRFSGNAAPALGVAEIALICVGTPPNPDDGEANLSHIFSAARDIARHAGKRIVVVTKSTVPVGTGDLIELLIRGLRPDLSLGVVSNPEFLKEGAAIEDFMQPDRIVIGANEDWAGDRVAALYEPLALRGVRILRTRRRSAEAIKYGANAFLAIKLSFINEMADFCEAWDADIGDVSAGIGLDQRIGSQFLQPGPGFGGSCFSKDLRALLHSARERDVGLRMVETASSVNEARKMAMGRRILSRVAGGVHGRRIAILGLTFKAETDDLRESPALAVVAALKRAGAIVCVHDPKGMEEAKTLLKDVSFADSAEACLRDAEILVVATGWQDYVRLDPNIVARQTEARVVFDLRNALPHEIWRKAGFTVHRIGEAELPAPETAPESPRAYSPRRAKPSEHTRMPAIQRLAPAETGVGLALMTVPMRLAD